MVSVSTALVPYVPLAGTWGLFHRGDPHDPRAWYGRPPRSLFGLFMRQAGFQLLNPDVPFVWTTGLDGALLALLRRLLWRRPSWPQWEAAAAALYYYLRMPHAHGQPGPDTYVPRRWRILFAHSHALQPVLLACARYDLHVRALVSIGSPIREGAFAGIAAAARPRIDYWAHFYAPGDPWQMAGSLFDGRLGFSREAIYRRHDQVVATADRNIPVPRAAGHVGLLTNTRYMPLLEESGVLRDIRRLAAA